MAKTTPTRLKDKGTTPDSMTFPPIPYALRLECELLTDRVETMSITLREIVSHVNDDLWPQLDPLSKATDDNDNLSIAYRDRYRGTLIDAIGLSKLWEAIKYFERLVDELN
ncbi:MAG: hypothetical protein QOD92_1038 [Acidimicrobiaceae bacterium]|jgi:hypothetical protein